MGTDKRARQKANTEAARRARVEQARRAQSRNRLLRIGIVVVVLAVALAGLALLRRGSDTDVATSSPTTLPITTTAPAAPKVPAGASITGATPCPPADGSATRTTSFAEAPPMCIDPAKSYAATVATTKGDYTIALDPKRAPNTVNNFVVLARYHFYDGVPFHRIVTGFMNQTGDATGSPPGTGGPGYKFADELPSNPADYTAGTVAMANSGPNTNGSQWFTLVADHPFDPPAYAIFGRVTEGMDVVKAINALGSPDSQGTPTAPVSVTSVTITES